MLEKSPSDETQSAYFRGLLSLLFARIIGHADADDLEAMLPETPARGIEGIPFGPEDVEVPEIAALDDDEISTDLGFQFWMGIKRDRYDYECHGQTFPEASIWAWLGYLSGERERRDHASHVRRLARPTATGPRRSDADVGAAIATRFLTDKTRAACAQGRQLVSASACHN